jgi:hypothetical protein
MCEARLPIGLVWLTVIVLLLLTYLNTLESMEVIYITYGTHIGFRSNRISYTFCKTIPFSVRRCELSWSDRLHNSVAGPCKKGNQISSSIKRGKFIEELSDC